eukprot:g534.t1
MKRSSESAAESISVRVAVRLRPLVPSELNEGCSECLRADGDSKQVLLQNGSKQFAYDHVFDAQRSQETLYTDTAAPLVTKCLEGYNATIFAYGQTGSGKTYTMGGGFGEAGASSGAVDAAVTAGSGIIPRAVQEIFAGVDKLRADDPGAAVEVTVSYLELYNEQIRDLLLPAAQAAAAPAGGLDLREDAEKGGVVVAGLTHETVQSAHELLAHLARGTLRRATASTQMNAQSSRSHAICTIGVQQRGALFKWGKINLVDLAGSERQKRTKAAGARLKEGISINKGLFVLGNVISALGDEKKRAANVHVPYRDSKLTRLLQDSLGGNSHTLMIACCSPADSNFEETLNTLKYANRARNITCKASVNMDAGAAELHNLRQQVQLLQLQLVGGKGGAAGGAGALAKLLGNGGGGGGGGAEIAKLQQDAALLLEQLDMEKRRRAKLEQALEAALRDTDSLTADRDRVRLQLEQVGGAAVAAGTGDRMGVLDEQLATIRDLRNQLAQVAGTAGAGVGEGGDNGGESGGAVADETESEFSQQQRAFAEGLQSLSASLEQKEALLKTLTTNENNMQALCGGGAGGGGGVGGGGSEKSQQTLQAQVNKLTRERDMLEDRLRDAAMSVAISPHEMMQQQQQRGRLKLLEVKLTQAKAKLQEMARLRRLKDQGDANVCRLRREIDDAKRRRAELQRRMKDAAVAHRQESKARQHELGQVQRKDRQKQLQLRNLQLLHARQSSVLQRKEEQVAAVTKRMRALLDKQRQQKRPTVAGGGADTSSRAAQQEESCKHRLQRAVDIKVALALAKEAMTKEAELRKSAAARLQALRAAGGDGDTGEGGDAAGSEAAKLEEEVAQRTEMIAQLQQRLAAFDGQTGYGADQMKTTWAALKTARAARVELKAMFDIAVGGRLECARLEQAEQQAQDALAERDAAECALEAEKEAAATRELSMQQNYEAQLMSLLSLVHANGGAASLPGGAVELRTMCDDRLRSAQDVHDRTVAAQEEMAQENARLKEALKEAKAGKPAKKTAVKKAAVESESEEEDWEEESEEEFDDHSSDSDWEEKPKKRAARGEKVQPPIARKKRSLGGADAAVNAVAEAPQPKRMLDPAVSGSKPRPSDQLPMGKPADAEPTAEGEEADADVASTAGPPTLASMPADAKERETALSKLTVPVLKEMLRAQKLKVSGKKSELVARLLEAGKGSAAGGIIRALYAGEETCTCNLDNGLDCPVCDMEEVTEAPPAAQAPSAAPKRKASGIGGDEMRRRLEAFKQKKSGPGVSAGASAAAG